MKPPRFFFSACTLFVAVILFSCKKDQLLKEEIKKPASSKVSKDSLEISVAILSITNIEDDPALLEFVTAQKKAQFSIPARIPRHE